MKREACYATTPFHTPTEGAHLISTNGSKGPCSLPQTRKLRGKGRQTFGAGPGASKRSPQSSSSSLLCPLSVEPDAKGAQQPAAARDNSLDAPGCGGQEHLKTTT